ncbi:MAG: mechanosensitive ion channel family protein [Bacilli bacterium]|nr:mechanosensitive ion channel family protein [Bacilli bacterium]
MENLDKLLNNNWVSKLLESILVIIIFFIVYYVVDYLISKSIEKSKLISNKKVKTYFRLLKSITKYIFIVVAILVLLQINGINVSSLVTSIGVIGIVLAFAVQDALKDIIKGFDILSDSYYRVGDVIKVNGVIGKVTSIGIKTTKLEDIYSLNKISISNRNIEQVEVVSDLINIDIPLSYEKSVLEIESVIEKIISRIKKEKDVNNAEYRGVNDLADSSIKYQIKVYCDPIKKVQVRRDALRIILLVLEENNIEIPYNQLDIHEK